MLYGALELAAKILGICEEYEAQAIVQEIANLAPAILQTFEIRSFTT